MDKLSLYIDVARPQFEFNRTILNYAVYLLAFICFQEPFKAEPDSRPDLGLGNLYKGSGGRSMLRYELRNFRYISFTYKALPGADVDPPALAWN